MTRVEEIVYVLICLQILTVVLIIKRCFDGYIPRLLYHFIFLLHILVLVFSSWAVLVTLDVLYVFIQAIDDVGKRMNLGAKRPVLLMKYHKHVVRVWAHTTKIGNKIIELAYVHLVSKILLGHQLKPLIRAYHFNSPESYLVAEFLVSLSFGL